MRANELLAEDARRLVPQRAKIARLARRRPPNAGVALIDDGRKAVAPAIPSACVGQDPAKTTVASGLEAHAEGREVASRHVSQTPLPVVEVGLNHPTREVRARGLEPSFAYERIIAVEDA